MNIIGKLLIPTFWRTVRDDKTFRVFARNVIVINTISTLALSICVGSSRFGLILDRNFQIFADFVILASASVLVAGSAALLLRILDERCEFMIERTFPCDDE